MNRRQFLRPFGDKHLLPKFPGSPITWLGFVNAVLAGGLVSSCTSSAPTNPTTNDPTQPLPEIVASNGTRAILKHYGRASSAEKPLLDAMREGGLNPQPIKKGFVAGTWQVGDSAFGWIFCAQNQFLGNDAPSVRLNKNDLWATYQKLSIG